MSDANKIFEFIKYAEQLKNTQRSASHTSLGKRESVAEHSWRMALLASCLLPYFPELDARKALTMCLIHDLPEAITGDVSAKLVLDAEKKASEEVKAAHRLFEALPDGLKAYFLDTYNEYTEASSQEAVFAKAVDKAETIIQHNQGINPSDFDYEFNLHYGKIFFENNEILKAVREIIDEDTKSNIK